jgi:hypothetical protein
MCWQPKREREGFHRHIILLQSLPERLLLLACYPLFVFEVEIHPSRKSVRLVLSHRNWFTLRVAGVYSRPIRSRNDRALCNAFLNRSPPVLVSVEIFFGMLEFGESPLSMNEALELLRTVACCAGVWLLWLDRTCAAKETNAVNMEPHDISNLLPS